MDKVTEYCEEHGIYEVYKQEGYVITYYSYYPDEPNRPFIKVVHNIETGEEVRTRLRYRKCPNFLKGEFGVLYNYCCG